GRGVVDEDVDLPEARDHGGDQRLDLIRPAGVARERLHRDAFGPEALGGGAHALELARRDGDLGAALPERLRDRFADAAAPAGDERDLAVYMDPGSHRPPCSPNSRALPSRKAVSALRVRPSQGWHTRCWVVARGSAALGGTPEGGRA